MPASKRPKKPLTRAAALLTEISGIEHQIKAEKRAVEKAILKVLRDFARAHKAILARRRAAEKTITKTTAESLRLEAKRDRAHNQISAAHSRYNKTQIRRLQILQSRLTATT